MQNEYDRYYPQYQFANGGPMQALSPEQETYDQKYLKDSLLQKLFQEQTKQQILNAFTPYDPNGGGNAPGAGGLSYLDQLLASAGAPVAQGGGVAAAAPAAASVAQSSGGYQPKTYALGPASLWDALYIDRRSSR